MKTCRVIRQNKINLDTSREEREGEEFKIKHIQSQTDREILYVTLNTHSILLPLLKPKLDRYKRRREEKEGNEDGRK